MDRNQLFNYIIKNNLKDEVKAKYGKPYNSTSTDKLAEFVAAHQSKAAAPKAEPKKETKATATLKVESLDRDTCFKLIKEHNWQAEIREKYGKPYNSISTDKLNEFISNKGNTAVEKRVVEAKPQNNESNGTSACVDLGARKAIRAICALLNNKDILKNLD
jgi:hypothetical protein